MPFVLDTSGPALTAAADSVFLLKASLRELEQMAGTSLQNEAAEESAAHNVIATRRAQNLVVSLGSIALADCPIEGKVSYRQQNPLLATRNVTVRYSRARTLHGQHLMRKCTTESAPCPLQQFTKNHCDAVRNIPLWAF